MQRKWNQYLERYWQFYVHCSITTLTKLWKQTKFLVMNDQLKQMWYTQHNKTHTYQNIIHSKKKKKIRPFATRWLKSGENVLKLATGAKTLPRITYETSKRVKLMEAKSEIVVWGSEEGMGRWSKEAKFHISRWISSGDLTPSKLCLYLKFAESVNLQRFHTQNNGNCAKQWIHSLAWLW